MLLLLLLLLLGLRSGPTRSYPPVNVQPASIEGLEDINRERDPGRFFFNPAIGETGIENL